MLKTLQCMFKWGGFTFKLILVLWFLMGCWADDLISSLAVAQKLPLAPCYLSFSEGQAAHNTAT